MDPSVGWYVAPAVRSCCPTRYPSETWGARILSAARAERALLWWEAAACLQARFGCLGSMPFSSPLLVGGVYKRAPPHAGSGGRPALTDPPTLSSVAPGRVSVSVATLYDHTTTLSLRPPPPFSWSLHKPLPVMAPPPGPGRDGARTVQPPSSTCATEEDIIDVDALPLVAAASPAAASGPAATFSRCSERHPAEQPIDVDDPATVVKLATASVGAPTDGGRLQPTRKFDGLLGEALHEREIEVKNEETEAARASTASNKEFGAPIAGAGASLAPRASCAGGGVLGEAAAAARAEVAAEMSAANRAREAVVAAISEDRNQQLHAVASMCNTCGGFLVSRTWR